MNLSSTWRVLAPHPFLTRRNAASICFGYVSSWFAPPPNGSLTTTCQSLDAWQMAFLSIWVPSYWESSMEPCSCSVLSPSNPMAGLCGSSKCGPIPTFLRLLLSFILPPCHGLMEKLGCMPSFLKKSPPSPHVSSSSMTYRGGGCLKNLCHSRQRSMALRTSNSSRAKASSEETRHGVLVSNWGTWWLLGPPMLVLKHTALRWWRGSLGLFNCYLFPPSGSKTRIGWLKLPFLKMKPSK